MSIVKTKTKMKSGTIAIIALSIVLVLSLVTTITLAYFTASRNVVTTIQFSSGVKIQMAGAYETSQTANTTGDIDAPADVGPKTLYWKAAYHSGADTTIAGEGSGTYTGVGDTIDFESLKVKVIGENSYVAVRITVTGELRGTTNTTIDMSYVAASDGPPAVAAKEAAGIDSYVRPQLTNEWMAFANSGSFNAIEGNGWYVYKGASGSAPAPITATSEASDASGLADATAIVSSWSLPTDNSFVGKNITVTVDVFASNTLAGLQETVNTWNGTHAAAATTGFAKL